MWCHLVSDESYEELHAFARQIAKPRVAFQGDHYDLHEDDRQLALELGAQCVDARMLVRRLNQAGLRRGPGFARGGLEAVVRLPAPHVVTERLLLRQWRSGDRPAFRALACDAEVMEFLGGVLSGDDADRALDRYAVGLALRGVGTWAVEHVNSGALVGTVGFGFSGFVLPWMSAMDVECRLVRAAWGDGLGMEASVAAFDYGFSVLELREIVAFTSSQNVRGRDLARRVGMIRSVTEDFDHPARSATDPARRQFLYRVRNGEVRIT